MSQSRRWQAALALVLAVAVAVASERAASSEKISITADKLEVRHEDKRALFEGHVIAVYGDIRLECSALDVRYDGLGKVAQLEALGGVLVQSQDATAKARRAVLRPEQGVLVLEGAPEVQRGPHRLSGTRITVHLESGRMEVEHAVGAFELPLGQGSGP